MELTLRVPAQARGCLGALRLGSNQGGSLPSANAETNKKRPHFVEPFFVRGAQGRNARSILPWSSAFGSLFEGPKMQCILVEPGGSLPSAKAETNKKGPTSWSLSCSWCPGAESNHRHGDFQSPALPTELPGPFDIRFKTVEVSGGSKLGAY